MSGGGADDLATLDIQARVARGARLLDRVRPGWWQEINLKTLSLDDCWVCVLGQLYGGYKFGLSTLRREPETRNCYPEYFGFTVDNYGSRNELREFRSLTVAWRVEIARRAGAAKEVTL
jgi:hypothetical protein